MGAIARGLFAFSAQRERSKPPALLNVDSMSPATLSLGMVASLQSPLPFHMAELL
jgi:hypothetical protein